MLLLTRPRPPAPGGSDRRPLGGATVESVRALRPHPRQPTTRCGPRPSPSGWLVTGRPTGAVVPKAAVRDRGDGVPAGVGVGGLEGVPGPTDPPSPSGGVERWGTSTTVSCCPRLAGGGARRLTGCRCPAPGVNQTRVGFGEKRICSTGGVLVCLTSKRRSAVKRGVKRD